MLSIKLYHGRKSPDENLNDWGTDGPLLRIGGFHVTYLSTFRVMLEDKDWYFLKFVDDLLYYDGVLYGDFTISDSDPENIGQAIAWFDPIKGQVT